MGVDTVKGESSAMAVKLIGFPTNLGMPGSDVRLGPKALRERGLVHKLAPLAGAIQDLGDLEIPEPVPGDAQEQAQLRIQQVVAAARRQSEAIQNAWRPGNLLINIGGDHSAALGSVTALRQAGQQFDVVWIDAHGDFNSPGTSPSGNAHGMVLGMLCGYSPSTQPVLDGRRVTILGARDLDPGEVGLLRHAGVRVLGPTASLQQLQRVVDTMAPKVFISFDLDSIDPTATPGVSTPVHGGFTLAEVRQIIHTIASRRQVIGMDVVEYNPSNDAADRRTATAAFSVLETLLRTPMATTMLPALG